MCCQVVNVRSLTATQAGAVVYVGRACGHWTASPLGNTFRIGRDGDRQQVIEKYRRWLWEVVQAGRRGQPSPAWLSLLSLVAAVRRGEAPALGCWCHPAPCHASVIARAVDWLVSQEA